VVILRLESEPKRAHARVESQSHIISSAEL